MLDPNLIDQLSQRLATSIPAGLEQFAEDSGRNLKSIIEHTLHEMNLVSREEFDIQQAVLHRTRQKLVTLETRVAALETLAGTASDHHAND
ncbi:MAG: accessory factor UbiK family protein [Pseudomonadota bacterium]